MSIPKFIQVGAATAGAAALALLGTGFTSAPASGRVTAATSSSAKIQPGGPMTASSGGPAKFSARASNLISGNWGGYATQKSGTKFRSIKSVFFVPFVNCADTPNSFSGHWVGLDGLNNGTVEQDGILAACTGATPTYQAWWEMFPKPPVYPNITIHAGDSIVTSVTYTNHKFVLSVSDTADGHHFSVKEACPTGSSCHRASAEVISEAPSSSGGVLPLTDFRAESYSEVSITTSAGQHGGLRGPGWNPVAITTENQGGQVMDQPSQLFAGRTFDMYWMREG